MNVPNGMEDVKGVFESIILGSAIFGGAFLGGCYHYINGSSQQKRTLENLQQIEVMNRALGDMSAVSEIAFLHDESSIVLILFVKSISLIIRSN